MSAVVNEEQVAVPKVAIDRKSIDYVVRSGIAGGIAGSCAKTLIAPLDRIKILFQTSNPSYRMYAGSYSGLLKAAGKIYAQDGGVRGFYQGHSATLLRIFPYAAVKFIAYEQIRHIIIPSHEYETHWRRLLSGSLSGLCSVFLTYPLDVIRVRLAYDTGRETKVVQFNVSKGIKETVVQGDARDLSRGRLARVVSQIYNEPSSLPRICNFFRGFTPTIYGMIPYAGVSFLSHDACHDVLRHPIMAPYSVVGGKSGTRFPDGKKPPLKTWAELLAGGLAGMFSQTAAYPFEIIRRRLQVGGVHQKQFMSIIGISRIIYSERGWRGFYVGLSIGYIKVIPMVACTFYVYERMKYYLEI